MKDSVKEKGLQRRARFLIFLKLEFGKNSNNFPCIFAAFRFRTYICAIPVLFVNYY